MKISRLRLSALSALLVLSFGSFSLVRCSTPISETTSRQPSSQKFEPWSYDPGPDLQTPMGRELLDINSRIPFYPGLSEALLGKQKFRPVFGPIPWRMVLQPNSVKILFIGQDGTHIAEAAGRPATAGFGGRAQDLAKYFGVTSSAAFINTYAFTIRGQYGAFNAPVIYEDRNGKLKARHQGFVENNLWLMSQDVNSPLVKWRNDLIEWIIRNNQDSLKMIVLFGGAARDAAGSFVVARGGEVGHRFNLAPLNKVHVPHMISVGTGGNGEAYVPMARDGSDYYAKLLGRTPRYQTQEGERQSADMMEAQKLFAEALEKNPSKVISDLMIDEGGAEGSGVVNPAQLGGYDIEESMKINGRKTRSLQGLRLSDNSQIKNEVLVVQLPHPTALSSMRPSEASDAVGKDLEGIRSYVQKGWRIEPDAGETNHFHAGKPYRYARADMGPEYYDFGTPASRMVNVSTAVRDGQDVVIFGTRDKASFRGNRRLKAMAEAKPSHLPDPQDLWTTRPLKSRDRLAFDAGPPPHFAQLMKSNLPENLLKRKDGNADFAHYRGTFKNPRVIIFADPEGYDDLITSRALTGSRGQFLQGLMQSAGVGDRYLVIKTAPFSKEADWDSVLKQTQKYREALFQELLAQLNPEVIMTDGSSAKSEFERIVGSRANAPVVHIARQDDVPSFGMENAARALQKIKGFETTTLPAKMINIPRSHLPYYARIWEGTSGDRVITSDVPQFKGNAFAVVVPKWAHKQKYALSREDQEAVDRIFSLQRRMKIKTAQDLKNFLKDDESVE